MIHLHLYKRALVAIIIASTGRCSGAQTGDGGKTYAMRSADIAKTPVAIGDVKDADLHWASAALKRAKIACGVSSGRGVNGFYAPAKDELRAITILKRDAVAHGYSFSSVAPPSSLPDAPQTKIIILTTVLTKSYSPLERALKAASIPCAPSSAGGRTDVWIFATQRAEADKVLKAETEPRNR